MFLLKSAPDPEPSIAAKTAKTAEPRVLKLLCADGNREHQNEDNCQQRNAENNEHGDWGTVLIPRINQTEKHRCKQPQTHRL